MPRHKQQIETAPVTEKRKVVSVTSLADAIAAADGGRLPFTNNKKLQAAIDSLGIDRALQPS